MHGPVDHVRVVAGMESRSLRHSAHSSTGVLPVFTTCFGPRTADAGLVGNTWPVISESNSHPHGGELRLHARRRVLRLQALYICRDIERPDRGQRQPALDRVSDHLPTRRALDYQPRRLVAIFFAEWKTPGRLCSLTSMLDSRSPPQRQRLRHPPEYRRPRRILGFHGLVLLRPNAQPILNLANLFES